MIVLQQSRPRPRGCLNRGQSHGSPHLPLAEVSVTDFPDFIEGRGILLPMPGLAAKVLRAPTVRERGMDLSLTLRALVAGVLQGRFFPLPSSTPLADQPTDLYKGR